MLLSLLFSTVLSFGAPPDHLATLQNFCPLKLKAAEKLFVGGEGHHAGGFEQVKELLKLMETYYGKCQTVVEQKTGGFAFQFAEATVPFSVKFRGNKITEFEFRAAIVKNDSWAKISAFADRALPSATLWVERGGAEVVALRGDQERNVSRSSQVFLLKAIQDKIAAGELKNNSLLPLESSIKSISFGLLHDWVEGTEFTLASLKNFLVIENDATASDILLKAVGTKAVEQEGKFLAPFLSFRQYGVLAQHRAEVEKAPRGSLSAIADRLAQGEMPEFPAESEWMAERVGWFATGPELCRALRALQNDPVMRASARSRGEAAYLEGRASNVVALQARDPGVAQFTSVFGEDKATTCLSLTVNRGEGVDENAFTHVISRAYGLLLPAAGK